MVYVISAQVYKPSPQTKYDKENVGNGVFMDKQGKDLRMGIDNPSLSNTWALQTIRKKPNWSRENRLFNFNHWKIGALLRNRQKPNHDFTRILLLFNTNTVLRAITFLLMYLNSLNILTDEQGSFVYVIFFKFVIKYLQFLKTITCSWHAIFFRFAVCVIS